MKSRTGWRTWLPRRWRKWLRRLVRPPLYAGNFSSWTEAQRASRGYGDPAIREKVVAAARAVRDGQAAWERDSVLFHAPAANEPLLRALLRAAERDGGRLGVADFGGALGSAWWQHRRWLEPLREVRWGVIEQPELTAIGGREFANDALRFYPTLADYGANEDPRVLLLSSVLAYLERPHDLLREARAMSFHTVIIDRTGFIARGPDRLTVQHVPPAIYEASYPCWFFNRERLLAEFGPEWRLVDAWWTDDDCDIDAEHGGLVLERRP